MTTLITDHPQFLAEISMPPPWIHIPNDSDFSLGNLPYGVASGIWDAAENVAAPAQRIAVTRLGDTLVNLAILEDANLFANSRADESTKSFFSLPPTIDVKARTFSQPTLNRFLEQSPAVWNHVRQRLRQYLEQCTIISCRPGVDNEDRTACSDAFINEFIRGHGPALRRAAFRSLTDPNPPVTMHLPWQLSEYTDFYASREHATNVGTMFRGAAAALQPNWLHLPVGYHGRASTVVVSGTPIRRPTGQVQKSKDDPGAGSVHQPTEQLDFELEIGTIVGGPPNERGTPLTLEQATERIFGHVLLNDWSARDIQAWEYVPLGPFTSKNFATTVSPWIVPAAALAPYRCPTSAGVTQSDPQPLPYLRYPDDDDELIDASGSYHMNGNPINYSAYDVQLIVGIQPSSILSVNGPVSTVTSSHWRSMYWTTAQQLVHQSVTGCIMRPGDLLGSGTISGKEPDSFGSLLELSKRGTIPIRLQNGTTDESYETRTFLLDGDTVIMHGSSVGTPEQTSRFGRVGFGQCAGQILPAIPTIGKDLHLSGSTEHEPRPPEVGSIPYGDFVLYNFWRSSSAWRVRLTLVAKRIPHQVIAVNIEQGEQHSPEFVTKQNPTSQVPVLEFSDLRRPGQRITLSQSVPIIEFLEEVFPDRACLLPVETLHRAVAREIVELVNAGIQPLQNILRLSSLESKLQGSFNAKEEAKAANEYGIKVLETLVRAKRELLGIQSEHGGSFCLGTYAPSIADFFIVPQLYNARRYGVSLENTCPTLIAIESACLAHEWFRASHPDQQPDAPREAL